MSDACSSANDIFVAYQKQLNAMLGACKTQVQHDQIVNQYVLARDAAYGCIDKALNQNDPVLQALQKQATAVVAALNAIDTQLNDIAKVIDCATQAAAIVGKLVAL
jgi:intracellular sulfur oxidation DsrE/DsrF family protein